MRSLAKFQSGSGKISIFTKRGPSTSFIVIAARKVCYVLHTSILLMTTIFSILINHYLFDISIEIKYPLVSPQSKSLFKFMNTL